MKQIVDKLNKIAKAIDENVDIPESNLITDSLDAITTALGGTPNDSSLIVDKLEDIAGVATGGGSGGSATVTKTFVLFPAGTYASQTESYYDPDETYYYIKRHLPLYESRDFATPYRTLTLKLNGQDISLQPEGEGYYSPFAVSYGNENYTLDIGINDAILYVPAEGTYIVNEDLTVTLTGKPLRVLPNHSALDDHSHVIAMDIYGKVGEEKVYYYLGQDTTEVDIPLDVLYEARTQMSD